MIITLYNVQAEFLVQTLNTRQSQSPPSPISKVGQFIMPRTRLNGRPFTLTKQTAVVSQQFHFWAP
jgi:hypothetical protein